MTNRRWGRTPCPIHWVFNDGGRVRTPQDWERRRREILELFQENVFGRSPQPTKRLKFTVFDLDRDALGGKAIRKQVTIYFSDKDQHVKEDLLLYIPAGARKPVPLILSLNFSGNQSVVNDPGVKLATVWDHKTHQPEKASEESRGRDKGFNVEKVLARGYAFATIYYEDIEPDFDGGLAHGIRPLFFKPDSRHVAIMGHSRLGKTVLWAGALDRRFAVVIANCPGEGGASLARRNYGETIKNLTDRFPYWFAENLKKYAANVNLLPGDTHELIALLAPRPVYVTGAEDDRWADPKGEFLALVAAGPVYRLLGAQDLGTDQMPAVNQPILRTMAFHVRTGKHEVTDFDWEQFLAFADMRLRH